MEQIMNTRKDQEYDIIRASILFSPIIVFYTIFLTWASGIFKILNSIPVLGDINEYFLGYGVQTIIGLLLNKAAKNSNNDYIAGPIEMINMHTFFFLGYLIGGITIALIFVFAYFFLERFKLPFIDFTISKNEWRKYHNLGVTRRQFIFHHYIFTPLANLVAVIIAFFTIKYLFPDLLILHNTATKIIFLVCHSALWWFFFILFNSLYHLDFASLFDFQGLIHVAIVLIPAILLSQDKSWTIWLYVIITGFSLFTLILFIFENLANATPMKYIPD